MPKSVVWGRSAAQRRKYDEEKLELAPRESMQAGWVWYSWGQLYLRESGIIAGPRVPSFPTVYRFRLGLEVVYIGETSQFNTRLTTHRRHNKSRIRPYLGDALRRGDKVLIESMERITMKSSRGYGLENSLVRQSFEGMAILQARMTNLEVLNFNWSN